MKEAANEIVYIPIGEIKAYENNPRNNDKAVPAVKRSMQRFGVRRPAIVDKNNVLIAGHTRIKAAIQLGLTEYPCIVAEDLSDAEAKAFRLADNRTQDESEWDTRELAGEFAALRKAGFDLADTGFDAFEIDGLDFEDSADDDADEDEEENEEASLPDDYDDDDIPPENDDHEEAPTESEAIASYQQPDETFACIFCCKDKDDQELVREIIGEKGELKHHYSVAELKQMVSAGQDGGEE